MMGLSWGLAFIFNISILFSLRFVKRHVSVYEMTANAFLVAALSHLAFSAVALTAERIKFTETASVYWILEPYRFIFLPCLYLLFLAAWRYPRIQTLQKVILSLWWIAIAAAIQELNRLLGLITFHNWNTGCSFIEYSIVFCLSSSFTLWFRTLLKKEGMKRCS